MNLKTYFHSSQFKVTKINYSENFQYLFELKNSKTKNFKILSNSDIMFIMENTKIKIYKIKNFKNQGFETQIYLSF